MRRRDAGIAPFTVMSCDNIPGNGHVTAECRRRPRRAGRSRARRTGCKANVAFPNGMVDRITPATTDRERQLLAEEFGIEDNWPVFCESFKQWVLEDNFPAGRPALEKVGVQFVADVAPYELMKIRILNGGHATIAYPAALMDIHFVHEAMESRLVRGFLAKVERDEIIPVVPPVPDTDLDDYFAADRAALRQSQDRRHHPPALPRRLQPPAQIHPAVRRRPAEGGQVRRRPGAGLGALVPLLLRRDRQRRRSSSPTIRTGTAWLATRKQAKDDPAGLARHGRHLRRCRQIAGLRRGLRDRADRALGEGTQATLKRYLGGAASGRDFRTLRDTMMTSALRTFAPLDRLRQTPCLTSSSSIATACWSTASRFDQRTAAQCSPSIGAPIDEATAYRALSRPQHRHHPRMLLRRIRPDRSATTRLKHAQGAHAPFRSELKPMPALPRRLKRLTASVLRCLVQQPERMRLSLELTGLLRFFDPHIFSATMVARQAGARSLPPCGAQDGRRAGSLPRHRGQPRRR